LIAASASAEIPECVGVVSIAPPFAVQHWLLMFHHNYHLFQSAARTNLPRLFVIGSEDNFTSEASFFEVVEQRFQLDSTTAAVIKGVDHFFARRERDLMDVVAHWLVKTFQCDDDIGQLRHSEWNVRRNG
jgi:alpha/beta superfamily hydrolase